MSAFEDLKASAITVAPYMGEDSVKPFIKYANKWVILLALTSNKGSYDFQLDRRQERRASFQEKVLKITGMGN